MFVIPAPDPIAFSVFNFPIYWYGITMALAILVAMLAGNKLYNLTNPSFRQDVIIEYAPVLIIAGIIGARLYFCLLNSSYYFANPLQILDIRQGGLSIHGAIIGGVLAMIWTAKRIKIPIMSIMDSMSCGMLLGQVVGRWGNYFNSEAYGLPVSGQHWGLFIPEARRVAEYANYSLFHPTFLYESILNLIGFGLLCYLVLNFGKKYRGIPFFAYLCVYSLIRFFVEQIRVDSALNIAGNVPIAVLISVILLVIGVIGIVCTILQNLRKSN